ncbi:MAG: hypothetical protein HYS17_09005 [Micavibrio aeruginosavorus]|uniref:Uncharacterized protein n=1 Tax=Micavibrio aeruginosavorus TaxID=349221 RepID=A0A7T5UGS6_9BACT|nr:MAG: hypothetical protein HYS17_09005 [Micavibrio aeruginosavorus]
MRGLNHPGVEMVEHLRDTGADHEAIKALLSRNHKNLNKKLSKLQPEDRTPGHIFELHTLEIALAYNEVHDLGCSHQLRKLDLAHRGCSDKGEPLASTFHKRARQTALTSQECGLVATGVKTHFH